MSRTALITGGAGAIARELSARLLQREYDLVLVDIDAPGLAEAAAAAPERIRPVTADLTEAADLDRIIALIAATPNLELFVNNAGLIRPGDYIALDYAEVALQMQINLLTPMRLTQAAAQRFAAERQGCILSIVSAAGMVALPGSAPYSASKFGLRGLLIALSQELAPLGIKVRSVFPGAVDTPMLRYEATHGGSVLNFLNKDVLTPADVAEACLTAIDGTRIEVSLPAADALLARVICAFPGLTPAILPKFVKQGEQGLKRFLQSRGLTAATPA